MINEYNAKRFCCEDISKIENYEIAVSDTTQTWDCHHRCEVLPCGRYSVRDLELFGLYYNRPASELIFLTKSKHRSIHKNWLGKKRSDETKRKISESKKGTRTWLGRIHSEETKRKMSLSKKGRVWANNGVISKMFDPDCVPNGWTLGRIRWKISP